MFTGIIEATGIVESSSSFGNNRTYWISSTISTELRVDQSVSHDGVCLTVEELSGNKHRVTAINETLKKTNLKTWNEGSSINLERCMQMNGRLDGHIVQGHVDTTGVCIERKNDKGSWEFKFEFDKQFAALVIEKGSISINGISLTLFNVLNNTFSVAIIPYSFEHTNIKTVEVGRIVNIEFDVIGKYVNRIQQLKAE
jgi:riboflavin synthase